MDKMRNAIRIALDRMPPPNAIRMIQSFSLPYEEELCLVEREGHKKSVQQIALERCLSVETVKKRRRSAFSRIASQLI